MKTKATTINPANVNPDQYLIDIKSFALADAGSISDIRLAIHLKLDAAQAVDLLHIDIDDAHYVLQVAGNLVIDGLPANLHASDFNGLEAIIAILEGIAAVTVPCFTWRDKDDALIDQPEFISLDPHREIARFSAALMYKD